MELFDTEFEQWVDSHAADDPMRLRLRHAADGDVIAEAINQIALRRKAASKFIDAQGISLQPKWLAGDVPVEQSTSAAIARFHASLMPPEPNILDMTMGMGVDDLAFASLPGARVTAIEFNPRLYRFAQTNYAHVPNLTVINADSVDYLRSCDRRFDVIYVDPARRDADEARVCDIHACTPDVADILPLLLAHAPRVLVKLSPMLDIKATIAMLPGAARVFVVEQRGECREILVDIRADHLPDEPVLVEIVNAGRSMAFTFDEEAEATPSYAVPRPGQLLYEPSVATMKAGPFRTLCSRFGISALHPNTHLYVTGSPVDAFPGKAYRIQAVLPYASGVMKRFARQYPEASVAVRNFPITAAQLKDKLRTRESSQCRVFGVTVVGGDKYLIVATPYAQ